jgi:hypothetical protein
MLRVHILSHLSRRHVKLDGLEQVSIADLCDGHWLVRLLLLVRPGLDALAICQSVNYL